MPTYRPLLHFTPSHGWMNDPNGLVYHEGLWHLFYQYFPNGLQHGPMHWGHGTSPDLIFWQHLPIVLAPDELGNIWSGSALVTEKGLLACFTHQNQQRQAQSYAWSTDGGRTFTKDAANPILTSDRSDFRDPKVFRTNEQWRMIVAAGPEAQIFGSPDLQNWQLMGEVAPPQEGWLWECPDLFELDGVWVLIGSFIIPGRPHETYYWLGEFDDQTYSPTSSPHRLSFGPDDYAAVSWNDTPQNRRVLIGWMSRWDYAASVPTESEGFRGAMTLPRELSLRNGHLCQNPPQELAAYRRSSLPLQGLEAAQLVPLQSTAFEIEATIHCGEASEYGFVIRSGDNELTRVGFDAHQQEIFIDRTQSGQVDFAPHFAGRYQAPLMVPEGLLELRIIVDVCSVEVFAAGGLCYGAALIFPTATQRHIEFLGQGAQVIDGQIYEF